MATMIVETGTAASTSNSYCSLDDADTYHEKRLYVTDWTGANDDDKEAALMWATRLIDQMVEFSGYAINSTQALAWPRSVVYDRNGYAFASNAIPSWLSEATAEFARQLIAENRTEETNRDLIGFKEIKVDTLQLKVDTGTSTSKPTMPPEVWSMIKFYGRKIGSYKTLVRI